MSAEPRSILWLDDVRAQDASLAGTKAAMLARFKHAGFSVPPGFVLAPSVSTDHVGLEQALARLRLPVAVRSSASVEDGADASFAGQFSSRLDVTNAEGVRDAVAACRASASGAHIESYAGEAPPAFAMCVLVQEMVNAEAAGVAFTAHPVTGDRGAVVINAVTGLGDRLLQGEIDADEWRVRVEAASIIRSVHGALTEATARDVAALAMQVRGQLGQEVDIEWAYARGTLYLLQARPIVDLPVEPMVHVPEGTWVKDAAHFPEPVTPLGATAFVDRFAPAAKQMFEQWGLLPEELHYRSIGYETYSRTLPAGAAPPWFVLGALVRVVPPLRAKLRRAKQVVETDELRKVASSWETEIRPALAEEIAQHCAVDLTRLSDRELVLHLQHRVELFDRTLAVHMRLFIPYLVAIHELHMACAGIDEWSEANTMELLQGLSPASVEPTRRLRAIADKLVSRPEACEVVRRGGRDFVEDVRAVDPELARELDDWIGTWGISAVGYDMGMRSLAERPETVASLLIELTDAPSHGEVEARRQRVIERARAGFSDGGRRRFDDALAFAEITYPIREDNSHYTGSMPTGLIRLAALEIGRRLVLAGRLRSRLSVAYLELSDLLRFDRTDDDFRAVVRRRRAEMAWVRAHPGPEVHGEAPPPPPDTRGLPPEARRLNEAVLWAMRSELAPPSGEGEGDRITGIGASGGRYSGTVRVVRKEEDLFRLRRGEVLVCPITTPTWSVYFARAGALVTDAGSLLSHAAIIAREHAVPAVVATRSATTRLTDGMRVSVDGESGVVEVLSDAPT